MEYMRLHIHTMVFQYCSLFLRSFLFNIHVVPKGLSINVIVLNFQLAIFS